MEFAVQFVILEDTHCPSLSAKCAIVIEKLLVEEETMKLPPLVLLSPSAWASFPRIVSISRLVLILFLRLHTSD